MTKSMIKINSWLAEPLPREVAKAVDRLSQLDGIQQVAIMPDVHLAQDVCVGAVVATQDVIYPAAVGNDIGCGMAALAVNASASLFNNEKSAARMLSKFYEAVPSNKHRQKRPLPEKIAAERLSERRLQSIAFRDGRVQLGTLGRGNHFLELQSDGDGRLWIMVHSGSRAIGQAIAHYHSERAMTGKFGLKYLDSRDARGQAYLLDVGWARAYALENRLEMLRATELVLKSLFAVSVDWPTLIHSDHNHVQLETYHKSTYWVHRKGAQPAATDELGVVPGSMGTSSFHTVGRGCESALNSCSHGAGRQLSRADARKRITATQLEHLMEGIWFDHRCTVRLLDEAPSAYKDIQSIMRAQRELVKTQRELQPVLTYKGG